MCRRRASKWRARVRRGDARFSRPPRSCPVLVTTHPASSPSRARTNRDSGVTHRDRYRSWRGFSGGKQSGISGRSRDHNLPISESKTLPRSVAESFGQSNARKGGDIADVHDATKERGRRPRAATWRGISAHAFTPPPKPTNIKMACMSLSMKVAVAASECPRARSSLSATARVKSRVASNERLGRSRCARLARRAGESDASERREREIPRLTSLRAARLLSHPQSP